MTRRVRGTGLLVTAGAVWLSAHVLAQTPVTELRGEGFVLRGSIAMDRLNATACDLDTAVRALRQTQSGAAVPMVVAVENAGGIREWLPRYRERGAGNPLGAYWQGLYGHHIVVRVDARPEERLRRVLHEYAHFTTHLAHPDPPRWLDEGVSEVWEHAAIADGAIEVGRPVADHVKRLRSGKHWIPLQDLLAANTIPAANNTNTEMFYAQSWALVHYLIFEKRGGEVRFDRLPGADDLPTDEQLRAYVLGPMAGRLTISANAPAGRGCTAGTPSRVVPALESLLARAQAVADGERPDAAIPLLQEALRLDAGNTEALETLGFVHFTGNRPAEAAAVFDEVIAGGKASHVSYYYRAVLAVTVPGRHEGGEEISQVEYLRKALSLHPGFEPAVARLREITGKLDLAVPPRL